MHPYWSVPLFVLFSFAVSAGKSCLPFFLLRLEKKIPKAPSLFSFPPSPLEEPSSVLLRCPHLIVFFPRGDVRCFFLLPKITMSRSPLFTLVLESRDTFLSERFPSVLYRLHPLPPVISVVLLLLIFLHSRLKTSPPDFAPSRLLLKGSFTFEEVLFVTPGSPP